MEENSTTNFPTNDTRYGPLDWEEFIPDEYSSNSYNLIAFAVVCLGISLCGLAGNGVVMWFLGFHTKQSPFTVYTLNLTVADFSLLLLLLLLLLDILTSEAFCKSWWPSVDHDWQFVFVLGFLCHLFDLSSLGLLAALSVERCVSILCPIWYRCHRPRHLSGLVSGALWALSGLLVSSLYVTHTCTVSYTILTRVALAILVVFSLVILVSNLLLFLKLRCGSRRRQPGKLFVAILLNVLLFFAFGIPFGLEVFINVSVSNVLFRSAPCVFLALLNCTLNPVIYVLVGGCRRRRFQRSVRVALKRVFEEKAGSDEGSHGPGDTVVEVTAL